MKNRIILSVIIIAFAFTGFSIMPDNKQGCTNVYIDFGSLDNNTKISKCITNSGKEIAIDILNKAGVKLAGTDKYGLKVICRVNGLPSPKHETCAVMPPEAAYWAFIVKDKVDISNPMPKWGWAQKGISEVYLSPGDSLGLVFTENNKIKWPS